MGSTLIQERAARRKLAEAGPSIVEEGWEASASRAIQVASDTSENTSDIHSTPRTFFRLLAFARENVRDVQLFYHASGPRFYVLDGPLSLPAISVHPSSSSFFPSSSSSS